jgi:hypothetical protein
LKAVEVSAENLIVEVGNQRTTKPSTMSKFTEKAVIGLSGAGLGLDELVRQGTRQVMQQAIEAELAELLERFTNVKTLQGQRAVVRNGYLPEREVLTAAGPIPVKVPKVRDRSGSGVPARSVASRMPVPDDVLLEKRKTDLTVRFPISALAATPATLEMCFASMF